MAHKNDGVKEVDDCDAGLNSIHVPLKIAYKLFKQRIDFTSSSEIHMNLYCITKKNSEGYCLKEKIS